MKPHGAQMKHEKALAYNAPTSTPVISSPPENMLTMFHNRPPKGIDLEGDAHTSKWILPEIYLPTTVTLHHARYSNANPADCVRKIPNDSHAKDHVIEVAP